MAQFEQTTETKVLRDPIHGYIRVHDAVIWNLIGTREVQRLRRIRQLGGNFQVWPTAEHSRFTHSLGVYELTRRMVEEVDPIRFTLSAYEKIQVMCAALLHDLGHGPFSHFFESITGVSHEDLTIRIIQDEQTQVHQVLEACRKGLSDQVAAILGHCHSNPLLESMISSQLDADRMDYLLRDSYMTGTSYGSFDLERILRTIRVSRNRPCVKESGMHAVEDYVIARFQMYHQVYLHPDARSYEILVEKFFQRYQDLNDPQRIPFLAFLSEEQLDLQKFLEFDESMLFASLHLAQQDRDPVLSDLAGRILNRRMFGYVLNPEKGLKEKLETRLREKGMDPVYYLSEEVYSAGENAPYQEQQDNPAIEILQEDGKCVPLSRISPLSRSLMHMENSRTLIYCERSVLEEAT